ncbi:hypothetical protein SDC9_57517 [bioreactor metagenome]|uniref:Four helix bundle protein n=1 Tax=bioreactor metagenome TaxID=1076179 RepID=A0A644X5U7_9ZZZZ
MNSENNVVLDLSLVFSVEVMDFCELLKKQGRNILSDQLFRSGTSIGANIQESQGAESRADFIHKLKIAYKEASETEYWLKLCEMSTHYPANMSLSVKVLSLKKLLSKIISTAKANKSGSSNEKNSQSNN